MTTYDVIDLSKYSTETLETVQSTEAGCDVGDPLWECLEPALNRRKAGLDGTTYYPISVIEDETIIHSLCHKLLILSHHCEIEGLMVCHKYFLECYTAFFRQLGFEPVATAFTDENRTVH